MKPYAYLAPGSRCRFPFQHSKPFVSGADPLPISKCYGCIGEEMFVELESGEYIAVPLNRGNILGVKQVEG